MPKNIFVQIKNSCQKYNIPAISSETGRVLAFITKAIRAKKILEIGTGGGYSTIWLINSLPVNGNLITIEIDKSRMKIAKKNLSSAKKISQIKFLNGDALDLLNSKQTNDYFDLIFIDGNKSQYQKYFQNCTKKVKKGGIIICDDILYFQKHKKEINNKVSANDPLSIINLLVNQKTNYTMKKFVKYIKKLPQWETIILPIGNGLSISLKTKHSQDQESKKSFLLLLDFFL